MSLVIKCSICSKKGLHITKVEGSNVDSRQCINSGYATNTKLKGAIGENKTFDNFSDFIKKFSKETDGHIWFPSMINLPIGSLYPVDRNGTLKWAFVKMIDIPEDEQENYPDEIHKGEFLTKTLDYENQQLFDEYIFGLATMRDEVKSLG